MRAIGVLLLFAAALLHAAGSDSTLYVGTYTQQDSKGIYAFRFDASAGKLSSLGLPAETSHPSVLAVHPDRRFVYAVNENSSGILSAFAVERGSGRLKLLNAVSSRGSGPCHVAFDKTGKSADNRFVFVADLGLDRVMRYRFDGAKGTLTPNDPPFAQVAAGSGPRHMAFRPDGKFVYVLNEMAAAVAAFAYDAARGSMQEVQTLATLPAGFKGANGSAEIAVHPCGKFLYASNRGHDSIAIFSIDQTKGTRTFLDRVATQGKTPRNFAIDPTGAFLLAANQDSGSVVVSRMDRETGRLTTTGEFVPVPSPVSVVFAR